MKINVDLGEQGIAHRGDHEIIPYIDIANIACGGHAGDAASVAYFEQLACDAQLALSAHLSYPDRENFGRMEMNIKHSELLKALDWQRSLLPNVSILKFHGALYNRCWHDFEFSKLLLDWAQAAGFKAVIGPQASAFAKALWETDMQLISEGFVERRYQFQDQGLALVPRSNPQACIHQLSEAIEQARQIIVHKSLPVFTDKLCQKVQEVSYEVDTLCIHSDSSIAVKLAQAVHGELHSI